jgi:Protein of unknown function (DUF2933)
MRVDMTTHEMMDPTAREERYRQRLRWGLGVFMAVAFFFLWQEHRAHLLGALPWLLLLACPAMHFFMHHGHGSHRSSDAPNAAAKQGERAEYEHGGHGCC